jgi:cobalamin biosynthesis protein CobD/CbiB
MDAQIFSSSATLLIAAFLLDLAIGDPHWLPHL